MTQEEKQLLLVDLCARLPHGVICQMKDELIINDSPFYDYTLSERHIELFRKHKGFYIKPYLRPMSLMTKEERQEYGLVLCDELSINQFDWLNKKMFDYRGLIPNGMALEAPDGMYNL